MTSLQYLLNRNQYLNPATKTKSKKGNNSAKIWLMISNIKFDLYLKKNALSLSYTV